MSTLQYVKYEICLNSLRMNGNGIVYLNGQECDLILKKFDHLLEFDCTVWVELYLQEVDDISQQIIESFAQFPHWSVDAFQDSSSKSYVCVYTQKHEDYLI